MHSVMSTIYSSFDFQQLFISTVYLYALLKMQYHTVQDLQDLRAVTLVHIYWDHGVQCLPISLGAIWCKSFNLQPPSPRLNEDRKSAG